MKNSKKMHLNALLFPKFSINYNAFFLEVFMNYNALRRNNDEIFTNSFKLNSF